VVNVPEVDVLVAVVDVSVTDVDVYVTEVEVSVAVVVSGHWPSPGDQSFAPSHFLPFFVAS
jgi:hypothetical protein